jgi:hypothetical protein
MINSEEANQNFDYSVPELLDKLAIFLSLSLRKRLRDLV